MNTVVVIDAARSACSSPGIRSLSVFIASAIVCGLPVIMVRSASAYRRRLSVMVVGAGACSVLSSGTGLTLLLAKVFPSSSCTIAGCGKFVTTCTRLDHVDSSILNFKPRSFPVSVPEPPSLRQFRLSLFDFFHVVFHSVCRYFALSSVAAPLISLGGASDAPCGVLLLAVAAFSRWSSQLPPLSSCMRLVARLSCAIAESILAVALSSSGSLVVRLISYLVHMSLNLLAVNYTPLSVSSCRGRRCDSSSISVKACVVSLTDGKTSIHT